ncbi:MAG: hypothetical protein ABIG96_04330, partial [Candidatus Micrarchaeota archaeon]
MSGVKGIRTPIHRYLRTFSFSAERKALRKRKSPICSSYLFQSSINFIIVLLELNIPATKIWSLLFYQ